MSTATQHQLKDETTSQVENTREIILPCYSRFERSLGKIKSLEAAHHKPRGKIRWLTAQLDVG